MCLEICRLYLASSKSRDWFAQALGLILCILATLPAASASEIRTIIYGHFRGGLDPIETYSPFELSVLSCFLQRLTKVDEAGRISGDLALRWEISDDGMTYQFVLDRSSSLNASDVKMALNRAIQSKSSILHKQLLLSILTEQSIKVVEADRVVIKLKRPYPAFLFLLTSPELSIYRFSAAGPLMGGGPYLISVVTPNKHFDLKKKEGASTFSEKLNVKVEDNLESIKNILKEARADILLGLPNIEAAKLALPDGYLIEKGRFANPLQIQLNKGSAILQNASFRAELSNIIRHAAKGWAGNHPTFSFHPYLLPPGLLPPKYYSSTKLNPISLEGFKRKWASFVGKRRIKLWANPVYIDRDFVSGLTNALADAGIKIDLHYVPYRELKEKLDSFDLVFADGASYFPDPDSSLEIWPQILPQFPFSGQELLRDIRRVRFMRDTDARLKIYAEKIEMFENQNWVIPLLNSYDPVIRKNDVRIPDNFFRPFDTICHSKKVG